ncbi:aldo/keto reductase [Calocera viscosa TUFC12733]|uniref:Aldo/keto reductase n=1 Tax=Calocera viscosa (strain TUFC12733) TaxID=1330018 RepID=A0A167LH94_CALVF|nr:aldo/keto reductase [Calocera viscosa TUFC12733]
MRMSRLLRFSTSARAHSPTAISRSMTSDFPTTHLGGSAAQVQVGKVGHGLMFMTWRPVPVPDEQCFGSMRTSLEHGVNFFNSGEFYGMNPGEANLDLIRRFLDAYPQHAEKMFVSVKSASPAAEPALRQSVANIRAHLGAKKLDLFQCARVDRDVPIEGAMQMLEKLRGEGLFDHIGISECSANTLRRACKVAPVAVVEIEVSPFAYEEETKAVIAAAAELNVAVAAYSPLGMGFLMGAIKSRSDLEQGDLRAHMDKWSEANFDNNLRLAEALQAIARERGITPAQLCIAWVSSLGSHVIPIPGSS